MRDGIWEMVATVAVALGLLAYASAYVEERREAACESTITKSDRRAGE